MYFNQQETAAIYGKVITVIRSCHTVLQLLTARKYATLYLGCIAPQYRRSATTLLNRWITRQKTWIIRNGSQKTQGEGTRDDLDRAS